MRYKSYLIRPLQHGVDVGASDFNLPFPHGSWGSKNYRIFQSNPRKRWGYDTADRANLTGCQQIVLFKVTGGTRYTLYLTDSDLCEKEAAGTWSYKTEEYATGNVTDISTVTVTGSGTTWTSGMVGDYFVLDEDLTADSEPDASWRLISAASATSLTLSASYQKDISSTSKSYHIRNVYTTPSNERWWYAIVNDTFCFGNGNSHVQKYTGSNYASALETGSAVATKARYGIEFANRLVIADYGSTRNPQGVAWSANGDPTDWSVSATAGSATFLDTKDYITGLGKVGGNLIVYFRNGIRPGYKTGISTAPIGFSIYRGGVGSVAPYGLIEANGTNFFIGRKDFYEMVSDRPLPIGKGIRDKFFEVTGHSDVERSIGFPMTLINRVCWVCNTSEGRLGFIYDYERREWDIAQWNNDIQGFGVGAI